MRGIHRLTSKAVVATPSSSNELQIHTIRHIWKFSEQPTERTDRVEGRKLVESYRLVRLITNGQIVKKYWKFNQKLVSITLSTHGKLNLNMRKNLVKLSYFQLQNCQSTKESTQVFVYIFGKLARNHGITCTKMYALRPT